MQAEYLNKRQKREVGAFWQIWTNLKFRRMINIGLSTNERPISMLKKTFKKVKILFNNRKLCRVKMEKIWFFSTNRQNLPTVNKIDHCFFCKGYFVAGDDVLLAPHKVHEIFKSKSYIWKHPLKKTFCGHVNSNIQCLQSAQGEMKCECKSKHPVFVSEKHNKRYIEALEIFYKRSQTRGGTYQR